MAIYEKFIGRSRDSFVSLKDCQENFKITYEHNFNFAYDVIDVLGTEKPDKLALLYVSNTQEEKRFTFGDMKRLSDKAANYFVSQGVKKVTLCFSSSKEAIFFGLSLLHLTKSVQLWYLLQICSKARITFTAVTRLR